MLRVSDILLMHIEVNIWTVFMILRRTFYSKI